MFASHLAYCVHFLYPYRNSTSFPLLNMWCVILPFSRSFLPLKHNAQGSMKARLYKTGSRSAAVTQHPHSLLLLPFIMHMVYTLHYESQPMVRHEHRNTHVTLASRFALYRTNRRNKSGVCNKHCFSKCRQFCCHREVSRLHVGSPATDGRKLKMNERARPPVHSRLLMGKMLVNFFIKPSRLVQKLIYTSPSTVLQTCLPLRRSVSQSPHLAVSVVAATQTDNTQRQTDRQTT
jgi:hypothetical protein